MNPLTTGEVFDIEFLNPNPSFSKTEKGPVYRVSFEIPKDVWDEFVEANTKGMILAARCKAVEPKGEPSKTTVKLTGELAKPPKEKKVRALSQEAWLMIGTVSFQKYVSVMLKKPENDTTDLVANQYVCGMCNIESKSQLDTDLEAAELYRIRIQAPYRKWVNK